MRGYNWISSALSKNKYMFLANATVMFIYGRYEKEIDNELKKIKETCLKKSIKNLQK